MRETLRELGPGLLIAFLIMGAAPVAAEALGAALLAGLGPAGQGRANPISPISVAVVLGLAWAGGFGLPPSAKKGLGFCIKTVLRLGIVLVGIKLSFLDVVDAGLRAVPVVVAVVAFALVAAGRLARLLGVGERMGILAAASTAICGVTAAVATGSAIEAEEAEVGYTVANVTLFGTLAMLAYPYLAHALFEGRPGAAGIFLGTAIHDTAQVMGAALAYGQVFGDEAAVKVATVTKLTRNLFLVVVIPYLALEAARRRGGEARAVDTRALFPGFVLGFVGLALVRTVGDWGVAAPGGAAFGILGAADWKALTGFVGGPAAYACLGMAMAAVGLSVDLKAVRALGLRPVALGALSALAVGLVALAGAALLGG